MLSVFAFSLGITLIDAIVKPNYFVKVPIKIVFFLALPMLFFVKHKDDFKSFKTLFVWDKDGILKALLLGIGVYAVKHIIMRASFSSHFSYLVSPEKSIFIKGGIFYGVSILWQRFRIWDI